MRGGGAGGPKPTAKKRADPAKTKADMAAAAHGVSPLVTPSAPKMIPNGNAPTSNGNVSRAPARNSARRAADCNDLRTDLVNGREGIVVGWFGSVRPLDEEAGRHHTEDAHQGD